jgi:uncharacterized protein
MLTLVNGAILGPSYRGRSKSVLCPKIRSARFRGGRDSGLAQKDDKTVPNFDAEEDGTAIPGGHSAALGFGQIRMSARNLINVFRILPLGARYIAQALIGAYRLVLSPFTGLDCRHLPTCSAYAEEAITRFGLWAGGWMTLARLCRCQPFGTSGLDFVPSALPSHSRWYLPWRYGRWRGTNCEPGLEQSPGASA